MWIPWSCKMCWTVILQPPESDVICDMIWFVLLAKPRESCSDQNFAFFLLFGCIPKPDLHGYREVKPTFWQYSLHLQSLLEWASSMLSIIPEEQCHGCDGAKENLSYTPPLEDKHTALWSQGSANHSPGSLGNKTPLCHWCDCVTDAIGHFSCCSPHLTSPPSFTTLKP